jgi:glycosyltransferase involved in cell wall biosynthesis
MNNRCDISVIIPCFNAARTLSAAIESALSQGDVAIEIVVVDDGSTDISVNVACCFGSAIKVITGPNRGVSAARNRGIFDTNGEWCVFLDADDVLLPGTLAKRLETANATGADVIICNSVNFTDERPTPPDHVEQPNMAMLLDDPESACATNFKPAIAALMYRRTLVERIGGFREDLALIEDAHFLFEAACQGASFAHSPHIGAKIRLLPNSLSRSDAARFWQYCLLNGRQIEALWRSRGALSMKQLAALSEIYNGAAYGLFRARDPAFRDALIALRSSRILINFRNRVAELLSDLVGHVFAVRIAQQWTKSRRFLTGRP